MRRQIGRYEFDLTSNDVNQNKLIDDLVKRPRGGDANKDGRAFELSHNAHRLIDEIAAILNAGKHEQIAIERLWKFHFNERPICLVDDFHIHGLSGESYFQLKRGRVEWQKVADEFRRQVTLDESHGLIISLYLVVGLPRNMGRLRSYLDKIGLEEVLAAGYGFGENAHDALELNPDLGAAVEDIIGSNHRLHVESAFDHIRVAILDSCAQVSLVSLLHALHAKYPHFFHPLEEQHDYDFILEHLAEAAPDVWATIKGPTLVLEQDEMSDPFTIPWGIDAHVDDFLDRLLEFNKGEAEDALNLADVASMLIESGWHRAVRLPRSRPIGMRRTR